MIDERISTKPEIQKYAGCGDLLANWGGGEFTTPPITFGAIALAPLDNSSSTPGLVYVANSAPSPSYIRAHGPEPEFEPPPPVPPTIGKQSVSSVAASSATVQAQISPHFWSTDYYVEYGLVDCEVGPCSQEPLPPGNTLLSKRGTSTVAVSLTGLTPGATYHFRFVAESDGGGPVFGDDKTFTTHAIGAASLSDGRAYEMVSPPDKNNADVAIPGDPGGLAGFSVEPLQASPSGDAITYASFTSFGDDAEGSAAANQYLSRRGGAGWATESLVPRFEEGYLRDPLVGFSSNLSHAAVVAFQVGDQEPLGTPPRPRASGTFSVVTIQAAS